MIYLWQDGTYLALAHGHLGTYLALSLLLPRPAPPPRSSAMRPRAERGSVGRKKREQVVWGKAKARWTGVCARARACVCARVRASARASGRREEDA
eukprot:4851861-Pleurochrysis_carterae.AAC.2